MLQTGTAIRRMLTEAPPLAWGRGGFPGHVAFKWSPVESVRVGQTKKGERACVRCTTAIAGILGDVCVETLSLQPAVQVLVPREMAED